MTLNQQIEETRRLIRDAFASAKRPPKRDITSHRCEECNELRDTFFALTSNSIDPAIIDSHFDQLSLFSASAYHYFLPAYLLRCLNTFDPSNLVCEFTLYSLSPGLGRDDERKYLAERFKQFTEAQNAAIISFMNLIKTSEAFSDFHKDADRGCAHWKALKQADIF